MSLGTVLQRFEEQDFAKLVFITRGVFTNGVSLNQYLFYDIDK